MPKIEKQPDIIGNGYEQYANTNSHVLARITSMYRDKLKLTINGLTHAETFRKYENLNTPVAGAAAPPLTGRICDADPASGSLFAGLDPVKKDAVRDNVTAAVKPHATTSTQLNKIKGEIIALDNLLNARKFSNEDIAGYLTTKKKEGIEAIKAQHKMEVEGITNYFDVPNPHGTLTAGEATALKTEALAKLATEQREQITNFSKDLDKSINTLNNMRTEFFNMEAVESQRLHGDKAMRDAINAKALVGGSGVSMGSNGRTISIEGIKLSDIKDGANNRMLHTFGGQNVRITKDKDGKESGFEIDISKWLGFSTVHDWYRNEKGRKALTAAFTNTAQALKAMGKEEVTCKATHPDEETAKLIARSLYEGALRGGFDRDKVKLKVNGKDTPPHDLFTPLELKQIHDRDEMRSKSLKEVIGPDKAADAKAAQTAIDAEVQEIVENSIAGVAPPVDLNISPK